MYMALVLKPQFKRIWLAALRSGKYKQGWSFLCRKPAPRRKASYCCLGVACEISPQHGRWGKYKKINNDKFVRPFEVAGNTDNDLASLPPIEVALRWFRKPRGMPQAMFEHNVLATLSQLASENDSRHAFPIDWIKEHL